MPAARSAGIRTSLKSEYCEAVIFSTRWRTVARLRARREAGGVGGFDAAAAQDHQAADADLEELVEIGRGDGEELDALQQRQVVAKRLVEHALVELDP